MRYFSMDESRFGLKTLVGRVITLMGVKPRIKVQWPRDNFWLYGAVEPSTGESFFYEFSHLDTECFQHYVNLFSQEFADSLNLLHMDQASCHMTAQIVWPENVIAIAQPPHSPELNPIERLWEELKKHLKGLSFSSLSELREKVYELINSLSSSTVQSLTGFSYILNALDRVSRKSA
jgi:hypothetical protein